jgi:ribosomal protein S18 acetylase RimI-like enzyme
MPLARPEASIRAALASDVPALARLGARLARMHHRLDPARFFLNEDLEAGYAWWLEKERRSPKAVVLAAVRSPRRGTERVVGYAYGRMEARDWNTLRERCGVGIDVMVETRERGRGTGRALVLELCARLEAMGAPRVVIQAAAANKAARRFFAALGFRDTMTEMAREAVALSNRSPSRPSPGSRARSRPPRSRRRRPRARS